jgi:hypothetical protein
MGTKSYPYQLQKIPTYETRMNERTTFVLNSGGDLVDIINPAQNTYSMHLDDDHLLLFDPSSNATLPTLPTLPTIPTISTCPITSPTSPTSPTSSVDSIMYHHQPTSTYQTAGTCTSSKSKCIHKFTSASVSTKRYRIMNDCTDNNQSIKRSRIIEEREEQREKKAVITDGDYKEEEDRVKLVERKRRRKILWKKKEVKQRMKYPIPCGVGDYWIEHTQEDAFLDPYGRSKAGDDRKFIRWGRVMKVHVRSKNHELKLLEIGVGYEFTSSPTPCHKLVLKHDPAIMALTNGEDVTRLSDKRLLDFTYLVTYRSRYDMWGIKGFHDRNRFTFYSEHPREDSKLKDIVRFETLESIPDSYRI